jgi:ABC-type cobalamin/Fe3+-siderophores transport system ATPase subunit
LTRPVVGWGPDGPVHIDYEQDSPHVALSGAAGTGKTTLLRFLLAQRMAHGVGVIFLDAKRWSHRWAHKLPDDRAQYWYRVPDMHNALVALGEELQRRIDCDESELGTFRELDVVVEEINSLIKMLTAYWRGERKRIMNEAKALQREDMDYDEADLDPPALSPAVAALQFAVNMGRELQIHVHVAAQRLEANVFGSNSGAAVRQSFQLRFMAKWDLQLWKMLASGHEYVAWPGGRRGLWGFVQDSEFVIVRVPDLAMADALAMATAGQDPSGPVLGQQLARPLAKPVAKEVASGQKLATILGQLPGQDGPMAMSIDGLRKASQRPGFPLAIGQDGVAKLYDVASVIEWREMALAKRLGQ